MNDVQTGLKCKPNVKRCKRFVFAAHSPLLHPNTLTTKAISHFQADHILTRFVFPPLDGTENSLWFVGSGETAFSSWTYVEGKPSQINIESVNDSIAYCISKVKLETLFSHSLEMANFGRKIFEREILSVDASTLAYGAPPTAKERYLTLMEENPELLQDVPLKYLASYLYITPQSLSRIRAGLRKKD